MERTVSFDVALDLAAEADLALLCYEGEKSLTLRSCISQWRGQAEALRGTPPEIAVIIGSEGGFSPEEAEHARRCGCYPVSLGDRILRTETVAPFVLGALSYEFDA